MKKIKKIISILLLAFMIVPVPVHATTSESINDGITIDHVEGNPITFEEMISKNAENGGITYNEALQRYLTKERSSLPATRAALTDESLLNLARGWYYWEDTIYVKSSQKGYRAAIFVYYSYMGSQSNRSINKIENAGVNSTISSIYKHFGGTLFLNVESQYKYYYKLNGAFYNTGTTTVSGGLNIGLGESATLSLGVSSSSNFYDGISVTGRIVSSRN